MNTDKNSEPRLAGVEGYPEQEFTGKILSSAFTLM